MAYDTCLKFALILCVLSAVFLQGDGDIHRIRKPASSLHLKSSQQINTLDKEDYDTKVYPGNSENYDTDEDFDQTKDYMCALLATFLVGLTGILPLALPIDSKQVGEGSGKQSIGNILQLYCNTKDSSRMQTQNCKHCLNLISAIFLPLLKSFAVILILKFCKCRDVWLKRKTNCVLISFSA